MKFSAIYLVQRIFRIALGYCAAVLASTFMTLVFMPFLFQAFFLALFITLKTSVIPMMIFVIFSEFVYRPTCKQHIFAGVVTALFAHLLAYLFLTVDGVTNTYVITASLVGGALGGYTYWWISIRNTLPLKTVKETAN